VQFAEYAAAEKKENDRANELLLSYQKRYDAMDAELEA
jgi:hypothetical protein